MKHAPGTIRSNVELNVFVTSLPSCQQDEEKISYEKDSIYLVLLSFDVLRAQLHMR